MKRVFIETSIFQLSLKGSDKTGDLLRKIQSEILANPEAGDIVPNCNGIRKLRLGDDSRGKGKRGGYRIIYLDLPGREKTYLIAIYPKGTKENLSPDDKKIIRGLVADLKKEKL